MKKLICFLMCVTMLLTMLAPVQTAWAQPPSVSWFNEFARLEANSFSGSIEASNIHKDKFNINAVGDGLSINSNLTKEDWVESALNLYKGDKTKFIIDVELNVPENAKKVAFKTVSSAFDQISNLTELTNYFDPTANIWTAIEPESTTISYLQSGVDPLVAAAISGPDQNSNLTLTLHGSDPMGLLICWLDENGQKISFADGKEIGSILIFFNDADDDTITFTQDPIDPYVPFSRENAVEMIKGVIPEDKVSWNYDSSKGELNVVFDLDEKDWYDIYMSEKPGVELLMFQANISKPDGAQYEKHMSTSISQLPSFAAQILNFGIDNMNNIAEYASQNTEYATVRRYDGTIIIEPVSGSHNHIFCWRDSTGNLVDILPGEDEHNVEYLKINVSHKNPNPVTIKDDTAIPLENIKFNTGNWDEDTYYGRDLTSGKKLTPTYENGVIVYFIDYEAVDNANDTDTKFNSILTDVKAPENAVACTVDGQDTNITTDGYITLS
ncbi:MAG: hypothetical protein IJB92_02290, partial [Clostridia bacterium]|nr:hypothetical protein [Clostridia bacterium]